MIFRRYIVRAYFVSFFFCGVATAKPLASIYIQNWSSLQHLDSKSHPLNPWQNRLLPESKKFLRSLDGPLNIHIDRSSIGGLAFRADYSTLTKYTETGVGVESIFSALGFHKDVGGNSLQETWQGLGQNFVVTKIPGLVSVQSAPNLPVPKNVPALSCEGGHAQQAQVRVSLMMPVLLGYIARHRVLRKYVPLVEQLGAQGLRLAEGASWITAGGARACGRVAGFTPNEGLVALLSESSPGSSSLRAQGVTLRAKLKPAQLHTMFARILGYQKPLRWSVVDAQIRSWERRLGTELARDALGEKAQDFSFVFEARGGLFAMSLGIADGEGLAKLLEPVLNDLRATVPAIQFEWSGDSKKRRLSFPGSSIVVEVMADELRVFQRGAETWFQKKIKLNTITEPFDLRIDGGVAGFYGVPLEGVLRVMAAPEGATTLRTTLQLGSAQE